MKRDQRLTVYWFSPLFSREQRSILLLIVLVGLVQMLPDIRTDAPAPAKVVYQR
jgi:hypothetical protein